MLAIERAFARLVGTAVVFTFLAIGVPQAATISTTDLWQLPSVTTNSGVYPGSNINDMFGATSSSLEVGNTLFKDGFITGTVHSVEWMTSSAVTLRSFMLFATHDGSPRDATYRGISSFKLFAFNSSTSVFDLIFSYSPANRYGNSAAPPNGVVETNVGLNLLVVGANLLPVTATKFRAEFVQLGGGVDGGPRINELDGFNTYIQGAAVPSAVPLPAPFLLLATALGALGFAGWWRKRRALRAA